LSRGIRQATLTLGFCFVSILSLSGGCSDDDVAGGGNGGTRLGPGEGVFVDSPVSGLAYQSGSKSGLTSASGVFRFDADHDIRFSIGSIVLGTAEPATRMSPLQLSGGTEVSDPTCTNLARFLQTIDDDGDPSNGIAVTDRMRAAAAGLGVNFAQSIDAFARDANVLLAIATLTSVSTAGPRPLVPAAEAQSRLEVALRAAYAGGYEGTYCRIDGDNEVTGGRWRMTVAADGVTSLAFTGTPGFQMNAMMSIAGEIDIALPDGADIVAGFDPDFGGRWSFAGEMGRFSESAECRR
jgi:hypothetical protein